MPANEEAAPHTDHDGLSDIPIWHRALQRQLGILCNVFSQETCVSLSCKLAVFQLVYKQYIY